MSKSSVIVHAGGAGAGGGGTYVLAVANELVRNGGRGLRWRFVAGRQLASTLDALGMDVAAYAVSRPASRVLWEQLVLPAAARGAVLVGAGGFVPLTPLACSVVVAHNALYYARRLPVAGRAKLRLSVERMYARASARSARCVVAPTAAMAALLAGHTNRPIRVAPFGPALATAVHEPAGPFTFLHRTHWGPHKAFNVLLDAVQRLSRRWPGAFRVRTACDPSSRFARRFETSERERHILAHPAVSRHVELATYTLGSAEHRQLEGHAVVIPSLIESFSFPLAEAMALQLPIVTVDLPYAREVCGECAFYAPPGDADLLAKQMERLLIGDRPPAPAAADVRRLSWKEHVDAIAEECAAAALAAVRQRTPRER